MTTHNGKLALIAVGGNSLILDPKRKSARDQYEAVVETCRHIGGLVRQGYRVVITHGNGPQVGFMLRRSELSRAELPEVPLDSCGADTQGSIGYQIQMAMRNELRGWAGAPGVATVVTQTLVDRNDPSWQKPSKPIGSFMTEAEAREHAAKEGWNVADDAGRGYRRMVASPAPKRILEIEAIKALLDAGMVVIAAGGGGIPVVEQADGSIAGAEAVIDKDLASSLLARELKADFFVVSTAVDKVSINFRKPNQQQLDRITSAEAKRYIEEGHFAPGSMKPKIQAVVQYLDAGGKEALITDPPHLVDAFAGRAGTWIVP